MSELKPADIKPGDCRLTAPTILIITKNNQMLFYTFKEALLLFSNLKQALQEYKEQYTDPLEED